MNKLTIVYSKAFIKDYKLAVKRGYDISKLKQIINMIANRMPLPANLKDHALKPPFQHYRELHIKPDWLLVYRIFENELMLYCFRTGTHQEVFKKRPIK